MTSIIGNLLHSYNNKTPSQYKLLDSFLLVLCLSAVLEFVYALCIDNTPYNAFLGR